ncbi:GntR family transcriptional regulator [Micromonospora sp. WMMC250]|uniref:GntR family transcriptional regulator n=1 Tax=Micromonospora sp. WMMC250 TaxID=3014781 RepID=UPI0022B6C6CC|nr:winged helix-turn-helix domain-containing protein [Micromonospora sp. WMMC250]MCZ7376569.1 winged helix-turn-helix domain-containing protein [Micromonospora sp. WMMC250]
MIDPHSGVPAHRQLAELLRRRIAAGEWTPGSLLPPAPRLRYEYGVGKATVQAAMAALRSEGLVELSHGVGIRVRERPAVEVVLVDAADRVAARQPTPEERMRHEVPEGVPVLIVIHPDGLHDLYPADRFEVAFRPE